MPIRHNSRSETCLINQRRYHVRHWGPADAPLLVLLHGWMDCSATFQFTVDALQHEWHVLAPDWRGFGHSQWNDGSYYFPDYLADLDALLARYSDNQPVRPGRPQHGRDDCRDLRWRTPGTHCAAGFG
ncbi:alpha/beta fold hydrolase [Paludibacterium denitrificans]|uniref:alpha/beta fold hydrolase n=1 Tax=Paludibacterium denitrificans TaxID=2675226 RepID=UPI001E4F4046|nr:alpha/beta fold hydrolase [Paludibacterium denitrificans]